MSLIRYQPTELGTWSPFDRLASLREEMNRLFDINAPRDTGLFSGWTPAIDVWDDKDEFVVVCEVPGLKKQDIDLSIHGGNTLTISGERKTEREGQKGETFRSERAFGKFQRTVTLPASVDAGKVNATYEDGVLTVHLSKSEEAKQKHIEVNIS